MHRYPAVNSGCLLHMPHCVCALRVDRLFTFVTSKAVSKSGYQSFRTQLCDGGLVVWLVLSLHTVTLKEEKN